MKSEKNGKNIRKFKDQFVETNKLDHRTWIQLGRSPGWTSRVRRTAELDPIRIQLGHSPSWTGSTADSARPFTELDQSSLANGRAGSTG
ncbi:unnamed protein product, partial [Brassica rapa]